MRQPKSCRSTRIDVACLHHRIRRLAHLAIQTEHRNAVHRIFEIRRLDHVVLLVAAQPMLRAERRGDLDVTASRQCIERMRQVLGDRSGMREQGHALAAERRAQGGFGDKPIDAEFHRYTLERIGGVASRPGPDVPLAGPLDLLCFSMDHRVKPAGDWCPDSEVRIIVRHPRLRTSESKDTSNLLI